MQARLLLTCLVLLAARLPAQTTQTDLETRLLHQPLYLRGEWGSGKLQFDETGHLLGKSGTLPFTLSGIEIHSVKLGSKTLLLEGNRVGVVFENDAVSRIEYGVDPRSRGGTELVRIQIQTPSGGDFSEALGKIFATGLSDFDSKLPFFWQEYGREHFPPAAAMTLTKSTEESGVVNDPTAATPQARKPLQVGGSVSPPRLLSSPSMSMSRQARSIPMEGQVLVNLHVGPDGIPARVRILRPLGLGLDEAAVAAVSQYRFRPAEQNGTPVMIEMNVDMNFRTF